MKCVLSDSLKNWLSGYDLAVPPEKNSDIVTESSEGKRNVYWGGGGSFIKQISNSRHKNQELEEYFLASLGRHKNIRMKNTVQCTDQRGTYQTHLHALLDLNRDLIDNIRWITKVFSKEWSQKMKMDFQDLFFFLL